MSLPSRSGVSAAERNTLHAARRLPPDRSTAPVEGRALLGGEPFAIVRLSDRAAAQIRAWRRANRSGTAARSPARWCARTWRSRCRRRALPPVSVVIPVRDRSIARLLAALDGRRGDRGRRRLAPRRTLRAEAAARGRPLRAPRRAAAARARPATTASRSRRHELVACVDIDCVPSPGWLEALLPHFADPELSAIAPRIVALGRTTKLFARGATPGAGSRRSRARPRAYEAGRSPLDRGPAPARVSPTGGCRSSRGRDRLRRHLRFDETLRGGEDVEFCGGCRTCATSRPRSVAHDHRTDPASGSSAASTTGAPPPGSPSATPGTRGRCNVSPWTTAAWAALAARKPVPASAIVGVATALTARELENAVPDPTRPRSSSPAAAAALRQGRRRRTHPRLVAALRRRRTRFPAPAHRSPPRWRPRRRSSSPTISPTASVSGRAASSSERSTRCCRREPWPLCHARFKGRDSRAGGRSPRQMGRDRGLARRRARGDPLPIELQALASDESDAFQTRAPSRRGR